MRRIPCLMLAAALLAAGSARAETATIEVYHLPLGEAVSTAQSQLSPNGRVAQLPSRHLLIVNDEPANIRQIRALLKRLDAAPAQLSVQVHIDQRSEKQHQTVAAAASLPGGWVRVAATSGHVLSNNRRDYMLRVSSAAPGHVEAGEIRAVGQRTRQYLTAHGIVSDSSVELLNVTGGFDVLATLLPGDRVRLSIRPWLRNMAADSGMDAKTEILIDAGSTLSTGQPPSPNAPMRINAQPHTGEGHRPPRIMVAEAATELTVKLGEKVTLAASRSAAGEFSDALFGEGVLNRHQALVISVDVNKVGM